MNAVRRIIALLLLVLACAEASSSTLVNMGDTWSYLKIPFQVVEPAKAWTQPDFDDSSWPVASSGFDLEHRHVGLQEVRARPAPARVFLRRRFVVTDVTGVRSLRLLVEHEQGFKAYLNGLPVATVNEPGMTVLKPDPFLPNEEQVILTTAEIDLTAHRTLLRQGENVLALEGDQSWPSASPVTLSGLLTANISRGPFIQNTTPNSVTVVWRTDVAMDTTLEFGPSPMLGRMVSHSTLTNEHVVSLTGLEPDTVYFYRVQSSDSSGVVRSEIDYFRTFKEHGPVRFVLVGDTGQNTAAQFLNARIMADLNPDLVLHAGDIIYGGFDDRTPDSRIFAQYLTLTGQMRNTPFFFALGNHDLNCCGGVPEHDPLTFSSNALSFQRTFFLPTNSVTETEHFYSFDHGDAHFVALYNPWFQVYDFNTGTDQYRWLTNDLAGSRKPWKILFFHSPMAHSGLHALADRNVNGVLDQAEMMGTILAAARLYGVQLVLSGHEHNYERFAPTNGVHTAVSGGGGAGLYSFLSRHPQSAQFHSVNHCLNVEISGDTAVIQAVTTNGFVFDNWVIQRSLPLEPIYHSAWNSPIVEATASNDQDGNINGQQFDFTGEPILGRHGQVSNLGWTYVNNDSTHLYLGFAGLMIPDNANLFLFIDSPRLQGVPRMAGVGDGLLDSLVEGADGLDCLENLDFIGFEPAIGCVLGEEFADANLPGFKRSKMAFAAGQGAFYLRPGLPEVPGIRLQQYNRSPQTNAVSIFFNGASLESNADYVELAIPLVALGDLLPGDTIRVAALVGTGGFDPELMTRSLDTAVLGDQLRLGEELRVALGCVRVRLAFPNDLDSDGDGLPDSWEHAHGLRPTDSAGANGPQGDLDGDRSTNMEEFLAGTDPNDPHSVLRLNLSLVGERRVKLEWPMLPGRSYVIQYADNQLGEFRELYSATSASRTHLTQATRLDTAPASAGTYQRTYRLQLKP
jgi:hypothetical protein